MQFNLLDMWAAMGFAARAVVALLGLMSVYMLAVGVERWRALRRGSVASNAFVAELRKRFEASTVPDAATIGTLAKEYGQAPTARVAQAAAAALLRRRGQLDTVDVVLGINRAVDRTVERELEHLKRGLGGLASIASTAPFVGLFGTVVGIINAFEAMAETGSGGLASVSAGIAEALVTTAFGLLVAIPSVALYNYFTGLVDGVHVDMTEVASELVEALVLTPSRDGA